MLDEHCHIVFGVDDGARTADESSAMLQSAKDSGIDRIICTPHMRWSDFDKNKVEQHFHEVRLRGEEYGLELTLGYEVFYETLLKIGLDKSTQFVTSGTNSILIEFNTGGRVLDGWQHTFYELQTKYGLSITLAHPERYSSVLEDFDLLYRIVDSGCRVQVSAGDLFGNRQVARCAKRIIKEGLCDALVSDAHRPGHYRNFQKAIKKYGKYLDFSS